MTLTAAERIDALAVRGVMLYLAQNGELRAKCEPCFAHILDAAIPMLRHNRLPLIAYLRHSAKPVVATLSSPYCLPYEPMTRTPQ